MSNCPVLCLSLWGLGPPERTDCDLFTWRLTQCGPRGCSLGLWKIARQPVCHSPHITPLDPRRSLERATCPRPHSHRSMEPGPSNTCGDCCSCLPMGSIVTPHSPEATDTRQPVRHPGSAGLCPRERLVYFWVGSLCAHPLCPPPGMQSQWPSYQGS